jgi:hypothetical protein
VGTTTGRINIAGSYIQLDGFIITNANQGVYVNGGTFITIQDVTIHTVGTEGVRVRQNSSNVLLDRVTVYDTGEGASSGPCVVIGSETADALDNTNNVTVRAGTIHDCYQNGIVVMPGTHHNIIENNTIYNCGDMGATVGSGIESAELVAGNQTYTNNPAHIIRSNTIHTCNVGIRLGTGGAIYNNVIYNTQGGDNAINLTNGDADTYSRDVFHNTTSNSTATAIVEVSGSPVTDIRNNIGPADDMDGNLAYDAAYFEAPAEGVFELRTGAAPIDAGVDTTDDVPVDANGKARPFGAAPDSGAYEFGSTRPRRLRAR